MINNNVATRAGNIVNNQNSHGIERSGVGFASREAILKGVSMIQDLKTAESALRRSEAELANVRHVQQTLDSIPVAAWRARADGSVEYFNKRMLDYTGNSLDRAQDWQRTGSIHPEDLPRVNDMWLQLLAS